VWPFDVCEGIYDLLFYIKFRLAFSEEAVPQTLSQSPQPFWVQAPLGRFANVGGELEASWGDGRGSNQPTNSIGAVAGGCAPHGRTPLLLGPPFPLDKSRYSDNEGGSGCSDDRANWFANCHAEKRRGHAIGPYTSQLGGQ